MGPSGGGNKQTMIIVISCCAGAVLLLLVLLIAAGGGSDGGTAENAANANDGDSTANEWENVGRNNGPSGPKMNDPEFEAGLDDVDPDYDPDNPINKVRPDH